MLDLKQLRQEKEKISALLRGKDPQCDLDKVLELDTTYRELKTRLENLKASRNQLSKAIGEKKRMKEDASSLMEEVASLGDEIERQQKDYDSVEAEFNDAMARIPNVPMEDIKISLDPKDNVCVKEYKTKPQFDFPFKNHVELNEGLHLFDFKRAAKTSGSGWPAYRGMGARLEWALLNYMLDIHIANGFIQWIPPLLVRQPIMFGSGQLPKFEMQLFKLNDPDYPLYLIPTAEAVLNGLHYDEIVAEEELPLKYVAYTPCFRREAGAAGSQERGLIRVHQFNKVEMFCFTTPEQSSIIFDQMMDSAEKILQGLDLHYRNMLLVTGDMSWASARTIDIEVWLPGQNRYYEVSSVSNCLDFQARRSMTRYRNAESGKTEFVHTLNGSGLATSRLMVALLENNQQSDGSVFVPHVLRKYLGGISELKPQQE